MSGADRRLASGVGFEEPIDGFADDELMQPDETNVAFDSDETAIATAIDHRSYLERDNFENELGSVAENPFAEDFSDIGKYEIVEVVGDDRYGSIASDFRPIIVVYAYRLPSNKTFDHQKFLRYLQFTLDKWVDLDYTIIYFHYGLRSHNKPSFRWLVQVYRMLDRRYKKNLKALYLVHPTIFIRTIWRLFRPLISIKFERKVQYVNYLHELNAFVRIDQLALPQVIKDHDASISSKANTNQLNQSTATDAAAAPLPTQQFNVSLIYILNHNPDCEIPPIVTDLIGYMRANALDVEGIFRRSADLAQIRRLQDRINKGEKINYFEDENFSNAPDNAAIVASVLLKTFLRGLGEPLLTNALYPSLLRLNAIYSEVPKDQLANAIREVLQQLPRENLLLLQTICKFLTEVAAHSSTNLMNANNLSIVFGPNLTWPSDRQVPLTQLNHLNNICYHFIIAYNQIFEG